MLSPGQIKRICETNFDVVHERSTNDELVMICPEPDCGDRSGNRSVNLRTGMTNCWRCGSKHGHRGPLLSWMKHLGIDTSELNDLSIDPGINVDDALKDLLNEPDQDRHHFVLEVPLPQGFTPLTKGRDTAYWRLIKRMAEKKQLTIDDFEKAGVGFTRESPAWEPFAIFPIVEWGKTVYYQGRLYGSAPDGMKGTKRFPSKKLLPVGASNWVYNIDAARRNRPKVLVIVESILNVLSFEKEARNQGLTDKDVAALAIFKHAISREQLKKILSIAGSTEISLLFDSDAMASAWSSASDLTALRHVTVCSMPENVDANDDAKAALLAFSKRKPITTANLLYAKLHYDF